MGVLDVINALARVAAERRARSGERDFAAVDPDTGQKAFESDVRPLPPGDVGFLPDVVFASQGRTTSTAAERIGEREATGLTIPELSALLQTKQLPGREARAEAQVAANEALAAKRRRPEAPRRSGATGAITDKDRLKRLQILEKFRTGLDGIILKRQDAEAFGDVESEIEELQKSLKVGPFTGKPTPTGKPTAKVTPKKGGVTMKTPDGKIWENIPPNKVEAAKKRGAVVVGG